MAAEKRYVQRRSFKLYFKSALCSAWFRLYGYHSSTVVCEGRLPILYRMRGGTVRTGKMLKVRNYVARSEIGAGPNAQLIIGDGVFINQGVSVVASQHIEIGAETMIGDFAAIYDSNYHQIDPDHPDVAAPVTIGANVWLGRGSIVLPGSKIGDHTVVAANSVVRGSLPARVLAAGNPAKVVRELNIPEGWRRME